MTFNNYIKTGTKFNSFTFVEYTKKIKGLMHGIFICDCGDIKERYINHIKTGYIKTCGCSNRTSHIRHGHAANGVCTKTYNAWSSMKKRCLNPTNKYYKYYGGRGITVCQRWLDSFDNFLEDMGEKPENRSLDRLDNNGNYEPSNCLWRTAKDQNNNKRNNTVLEFNGEKNTISQWSEITKIKDCTISERLKRGWSIEKTLTTKTHKYTSSKSL